MNKHIYLLMTTVVFISALTSALPILADEMRTHEYSMINGHTVEIKDCDLVDATGDDKGDRAELLLDSKEKTLIIDGSKLLMPLVDGKWNVMNNYLFDENDDLKENMRPLVGAAINAVAPDYLQTGNGWSWQNGRQSGITVAGYNYQNSLKMYDNISAAMLITGVAGFAAGNPIRQILGVLGVVGIDGLGLSAIKNELSNLKNAYDKTTDRGFGTVTTTKGGRFYDYFYNDSWGTPQSALSKADGSDKRTPNNWPGGLNAMHMDFYLGWSCDYNSSGRWVGVNGNKVAY
ncbi:hypothetical protein H9L19_07830 [Weissella diestrammenae]|uniref:Uncharacterized protein n=1 Tax=Weissella diestrammenae TaxID=1162633 RepID=A0A7G9T586_9LACO|nr:hypothetical protein [Weissella diestrammenae]MCM0583116.1 hypothetical protein [Weissella diestrammenae]QNN75261.1 hypothetical protein H9L19_07830 [Weissella diestrammenae]